MIASWGIARSLVRVQEKIAAPTMVAESEAATDTGVPGGWPKKKAITAPRAAIWASARSTKMTPRSSTWRPR